MVQHKSGHDVVQPFLHAPKMLGVVAGAWGIKIVARWKYLGVEESQVGGVKIQIKQICPALW